MRLQVYLSHSGVASRRASAHIIAEGRVRVNGQVITQPGYAVSLTDKVMVDASPVCLEEENRYIMLNKPLGCISSSSDPQNRPTVIDIVQKSFSERLFPVGRLDYNSTGLIFITNDGKFSQKVSHPRSGYVKKYRVRSSSQISRNNLEIWIEGINIGGTVYRLHEYKIVNEDELILSLIEGKNREIRTVLEHFNISVLSLHRFQYGPQAIGNLGSGRFRLLSKREVNRLLD